MMRFVLAVGAAALCAVPALAANECNDGLTASQIGQLLTTGTVYACGTNGTETWNEYLVGGNQVWDYKLGPNPSSTDPSAQVGTYSIDSGNNTITYTYNGGGVFTYRVSLPTDTTFPGAGNYYFCQQPSGTAYLIHVSGSANCTPP